MGSWTALIVPFLVYWLILFVACYIVTDYGHYNLYDERPKLMGLRVLIASLILAGLLTWTRSSYDTMLTSEIHWTILQAIIWFLVFMFVLLFHPPHAVTLGVITMLLITGLASMGVDSLTRTDRRPHHDLNRPSKPYRQTMPANPGATAPTTKAAEPAKQ